MATTTTSTTVEEERVEWMHRHRALHFLVQEGIGEDEANTFLNAGYVEIKLNDQGVVLYRIILERRVVRGVHTELQ